MTNYNKCSICKSIGTNSTTCPMNPYANTKNFKKHYLVTGSFNKQVGGFTTIPISGSKRPYIERKYIYRKLEPLNIQSAISNRTKKITESKKYNIDTLKPIITKIFTKIIPKILTCNYYTGGKRAEYYTDVSDDNEKYNSIFHGIIDSIEETGFVSGGKNRKEIINKLTKKYGKNITLPKILDKVNIDVATIDEFNKEFSNYYYINSFIINYLSYLLKIFYANILNRSDKSSEYYDYTGKIHCAMINTKILKELKKELNKIQKLIGYNGEQSNTSQKYTNSLLEELDTILNLYDQINKNIKHNTLYRYNIK